MNEAPFNHPYVDESRAPIYRCKFPENMTQPDFEAYLAHLEAWEQYAHGHYAWIIYPDLRTPQMRLAMGESQKRRVAYEKGHLSCLGFVVTNAFMRGVITAMMWLGPHNQPLRVFDSEDKARAWVMKTHAEFVAHQQAIPAAPQHHAPP